MKVGYARTSTWEQVAGLEAQQKELVEAGCEKVFTEQVSSLAKRDQLDAALDYLREGDVLIVAKLDRLARSVKDLLQIVEVVEGKKASLQILAMNLDTKTATGRLILQVVGSIAEFERSMMLERQREGIAKAKAENKYKGRARTAQAKYGEVQSMLEAGINPTEIAERLGIGRSSVYRAIGERKLKRRAAYVQE